VVQFELEKLLGAKVNAYSLGHLSKSRVWWNRDPFDDSDRPESIALELWIPRGPRSEYALLGASLDSHAKGVHVHVNCPEDAGSWHGSLAEATDEVRQGLPNEYRESVQRAGEKGASVSLAQGAITYDRAAHGAIGSSSVLFGRMAAAIVTILADRKSFSTEDQMRQILQSIRDS
jgi:hypothetical protein